MKKLFYFGLLGLALYEIANVYFIMPMPGSQRMNSINLAYFIYSYRWWFRIIFIGMILVGAMDAFSIRWKWGSCHCQPCPFCSSFTCSTSA
ncbi:MAG: hypothetical protein WDO15_29855 [Bacteroidota bacterium]